MGILSQRELDGIRDYMNELYQVFARLPEKVTQDWSEYPVGTRAPAIGGGHWHKTLNGWKWNGPFGSGGTFPTPGGDNNGTVILIRKTYD